MMAIKKCFHAVYDNGTPANDGTVLYTVYSIHQKQNFNIVVPAMWTELLAVLNIAHMGNNVTGSFSSISFVSS